MLPHALKIFSIFSPTALGFWVGLKLTTCFSAQTHLTAEGNFSSYFHSGRRNFKSENPQTSYNHFFIEKAAYLFSVQLSCNRIKEIHKAFCLCCWSSLVQFLCSHSTAAMSCNAPASSVLLHGCSLGEGSVSPSGTTHLHLKGKLLAPSHCPGRHRAAAYSSLRFYSFLSCSALRLKPDPAPVIGVHVQVPKFRCGLELNFILHVKGIPLHRCIPQHEQLVPTIRQGGRAWLPC